MFFNDAKVASSVLDITLTKRGKWNDQDIPMCGIPFHSVDNYLKKLINKGFRIAICEQMKSNSVSINKTRGPMERNVVRIMTPGTVLEENHFTDII
tara:strand:+ start:711 stop:998 length:288 start_codon:yes stop_codon:yes gene_type:complete